MRQSLRIAAKCRAARMDESRSHRWTADEQRRLLLDGISGYAIFMLAPDGTIESWNRGGELLFGYARDQIVGQQLRVLFPEEQGSDADEALRRALDDGRSEDEGFRVRRDGSRFWSYGVLTPIRDEGGGMIGFALVTRDLTERRTSETRARIGEERFRLMVESVRDYAIFMLDPAGRVATWNRGAERIKGYRAEEIIGRHFSQFYPREDLDWGKPAWELRVAAQEGRFEDEGWRVRKDGTRFWANVIITALRDPESGELVGFGKVTRDLTERKRSEEERVKLAQAEEAVRLRDEFLSIASHELKTPLTALQLQLQSLQLRMEQLDGKLASKISRATRSGARLADLIEALLDVSRIASGRFELRRETFDLASAAAEVIERMRETAAKARCEVSLSGDRALHGLWDRLRVEQVITNLLSTAFKYAAGGAVELRLSREGDEAVLRVRDRGPGIPPQDVERIFGRFERAVSMRHYGGMGLGLYVTRQIVDAHGGAVSAANLPDGGAEFTVRLPALPAGADDAPRGELH